MLYPAPENCLQFALPDHITSSKKEVLGYGEGRGKEEGGTRTLVITKIIHPYPPVADVKRSLAATAATLPREKSAQLIERSYAVQPSVGGWVSSWMLLALVA